MFKKKGYQPLHQVVIPSVDSNTGLALIPFVLSIVAGSSDTISFLGFDGLFTAHITGNLVILASHLVAGNYFPIAQILSVPVFLVMLVLSKLLVNGLERLQIPTLKPLLTIHFLFLASSFLLAIQIMHQGKLLDAANTIIAGMLGVCAMAIQNALVQTSLKGAPPTAVMTTNITRFTMDAAEMLLGYNKDSIDKARVRAAHTWPAIVGFMIGCGLGAAFKAVANLWALALPTALAFVALVLARATMPKAFEI